MTSSPEIAAILRRPRARRRLAHRPPAELPWLDDLQEPPPAVLLDTTVYIDVLQGRAGAGPERLLGRAVVRHSPVARAELAVAIGRLDPRHGGTRAAVREITALLERIDRRTILPVGDAVWLEAGAVAGLMARLRRHGADQRRRALNDALLLLSARAHGCTLLSRDHADLDLLGQLLPDARLLFYRRAGEAGEARADRLAPLW